MDSQQGSRLHLVPKSEARKWSQILALIPVYLLQICYGMNTGYPAILTPQLSEKCSEFHITIDEVSWIVSMDNILTPVVCILSGFLQQSFGPKMVLMLGCLPYILGWLCAAFATSMTYLYVSRLLVGVGHAIITTTVYTVEVASKDMRGSYSLLEAVLRCAGCLAIYALGFFLRWNTIAIFAPIVPISAFIVTFLIPESPVFLLHKGKVKQAKKALKMLYGPRYKVDEELQIIQDNLRQQREKADEFRTKGEEQDNKFINGIQMKIRQMRVVEVYQPILIVMLMSVIQQFSGMSILRAYVVKIFDNIFAEDATSNETLTNYTRSSDGFHQFIIRENNNSSYHCSGDVTSSEAYYSAIILGFFRLVASMLLSNLLLKYARRTMYFISCAMTISSLLAFATFNFLVAEVELSKQVSTGLKWSALAAACTLVFAVQLGVQTLPMLLSGELFPSEVRAFCKGLTRSFSCILLVVSLKLFPVLESTMTFHGTFYFFAGILTLSVPVVYFTLPETKDLGLELIQHYFTKQRTIFYLDIDLEKEEQNNNTNNNQSKIIVLTRNV